VSELNDVAPLTHLSRREIGRGALAAAASICLPIAASAAVDGKSTQSGTFVLVPGAWHGGWCYGRTAKLLRDRGHVVFTPTLSGLAERAHEFSGSINLSTHVDDIVNLFRFEELEKVVLCGHSYGGMVITGVGARITAKISAIVYLDAFLPSDNESVLDTQGPEIQKNLIQQAGRLGGFGIPPYTAAYMQVNEKDRAWVDRLCTNQPFPTFIEKVGTISSMENIPRKHYIMVEHGGFQWAYDKTKDRPGWTRETVRCGHDVMIDDPEFLANRLESLLI
jgi:pimeloyl-ACP methyl ester carboxylesterase